MELDATSKALFREIDNIEDENAYNVNILLQTVEAEQKRSSADHATLNDKIHNLHSVVETRHSVIVQLQAKLKHAEASARLEKTRSQNQLDTLKTKLESQEREHGEQIECLKARVKRSLVDLDCANRTSQEEITRRNIQDSKLRETIKGHLGTISERDNEIAELSAKLATLNSQCKAQRARHERVLMDMGEQMVLVQRVREEEAIGLKENMKMQREAHRQELDMKLDKLEHIEDILLKSDERMADKVKVIKSEYESKIHQMQTLSNENTREIGRLRLELDDKTKQIYAAEGEKNAKTTEIGHLKQSLENFRLEIKDIQHDKLVKEQSLKNGFDADKTRYQEIINKLTESKKRGAAELSNLSTKNDQIAASLDGNFQKMLDQQKIAQHTSRDYHTAVKENFKSLINQTQSALTHIS